jgi:tetratricopeptide (TPR) repeat protein
MLKKQLKQRSTPKRQQQQKRRKGAKKFRNSEFGFEEEPESGWFPKSDIRIPNSEIAPMFSSRNIHFAILGLILGAVTGYIFAFYQAQTSLASQAPSAANAGGPQNHPEVSTEEILSMFKLAMERNPNEPELLARYASFLFSLGRFQESVEWFQKSLANRPNHLSTMEDLFNAQLEGLKDARAAADTLAKMSQMDPTYASLPALKKRLEERTKAAR